MGIALGHVLRQRLSEFSRIYSLGATLGLSSVGLRTSLSTFASDCSLFIFTLRTGYWLGGSVIYPKAGVAPASFPLSADALLLSYFGMVHERSRGTLSLLELFMRELSEIGHQKVDFDYSLFRLSLIRARSLLCKSMGVNSRRYFMNHGDSLPGSILLIVMCCATL